MPLTNLAAFTVASAVLIVTPGPNFLYILTRGATQGRQAALFSTVGLGCGVILHTLVTAAGLAALLASSELAFQAVKVAGGLVLILLGLQKLVREERLALRPRQASTRPLSLVWESIAMSLTNAKTLLFFLTFLPQFVEANVAPVFGQMAALGGVYVLLTVTIYGTVGLFGGALGDRLLTDPRFTTGIRRMAGLIFIGLGVLAFSAHRPGA
jgi:threonine/homoserine/homoserine lactone efflux protein